MDFTKMVETFIPTLEYCSLTINFANKDGIHIFFDNGEYCLLDLNTDNEYFFSSNKNLFEKAKDFLKLNDVLGVEIIKYHLK